MRQPEPTFCEDDPDSPADLLRLCRLSNAADHPPWGRDDLDLASLSASPVDGRRVDPRRREIAGRRLFDLNRAGRVADIAVLVNAAMFGRRLRERGCFAGDDVDDASGNVRRVERFSRVHARRSH